MTQTIDLDCEPGAIRPKDLIDQVIEGLGIEPLSRDVLTFFGRATWEFDVPREEWVESIQPTLKARITALYEIGAIRYGSW